MPRPRAASWAAGRSWARAAAAQSSSQPQVTAPVTAVPSRSDRSQRAVGKGARVEVARDAAQHPLDVVERARLNDLAAGIAPSQVSTSTRRSEFTIAVAAVGGTAADVDGHLVRATGHRASRSRRPVGCLGPSSPWPRMVEWTSAPTLGGGSCRRSGRGTVEGEVVGAVAEDHRAAVVRSHRRAGSTSGAGVGFGDLDAAAAKAGWAATWQEAAPTISAGNSGAAGGGRLGRAWRRDAAYIPARGGWLSPLLAGDPVAGRDRRHSSDHPRHGAPQLGVGDRQRPARSGRGVWPLAIRASTVVVATPAGTSDLPRRGGTSAARWVCVRPPRVVSRATAVQPHPEGARRQARAAVGAV